MNRPKNIKFVRDYSVNSSFWDDHIKNRRVLGGKSYLRAETRVHGKPQYPGADKVVSGLRYYNPGTGTWISRDPSHEKGGINLYGMVRNDPINFWDYLGLDRQQPFDWHHNYPQKFKSYFKSKGIDINDGSRGVLMLQGDHLAFKDSYNNAWEEFINSDAGRKACAGDVEKHFNEKIRPQFDENYRRSAPAGDSYSKWSKRTAPDKLELGSNKLGKVVTGLAVIGIIAETASAVEWMNRENVALKMGEFADLMAESDPLSKQIGLTTWYMQNFPGLADPMTSFSKKFGSQAGEPWNAELVAKFKQSFQNQSDDE